MKKRSLYIGLLSVLIMTNSSAIEDIESEDSSESPKSRSGYSNNNSSRPSFNQSSSPSSFPFKEEAKEKKKTKKEKKKANKKEEKKKSKSKYNGFDVPPPQGPIPRHSSPYSYTPSNPPPQSSDWRSSQPSNPAPNSDGWRSSQSSKHAPKFSGEDSYPSGQSTPQNKDKSPYPSKSSNSYFFPNASSTSSRKADKPESPRKAGEFMKEKREAAKKALDNVAKTMSCDTIISFDSLIEMGRKPQKDREKLKEECKRFFREYQSAINSIGGDPLFVSIFTKQLYTQYENRCLDAYKNSGPYLVATRDKKTIYLLPEMGGTDIHSILNKRREDIGFNGVILRNIELSSSIPSLMRCTFCLYMKNQESLLLTFQEFICDDTAAAPQQTDNQKAMSIDSAINVLFTDEVISKLILNRMLRNKSMQELKGRMNNEIIQIAFNMSNSEKRGDAARVLRKKYC